MSEKLKEGTKIIYNGNGYTINGEIVGIAGSEQAIVGFNYIIKIINIIGKIDYEYSCISLPRVCFTVIE